MTTPFASLTAAQQAVVVSYDKAARDYYEAMMHTHRLGQLLAAQHAQNATLFLTIMDTAELLPIPSGASPCATAGCTNNLNNARIAAEAVISANVTAKAVFRQMLGSDRCAELGA
jgi:hypothetical protein